MEKVTKQYEQYFGKKCTQVHIKVSENLCSQVFSGDFWVEWDILMFACMCFLVFPQCTCPGSVRISY